MFACSTTEGVSGVVDPFFNWPVSGRFLLQAQKIHYRFPSTRLSGSSDEVFDHLYRGEVLKITDPSRLIAPNISMDPLAFGWNQMDKQRIVRFHPWRDLSCI